jgi:hypothetical protein
MVVTKTLALACVVLLLAISGCGGPSSANQLIDAEIARAGGSRNSVYPLAGQILIDGLPAKTAKAGQKIIVMLNNASQPNAPLGARSFVECGRDGRFVFRTYLDADGVPPGHYVVAIAQLTYRKKRGYIGPDGLKNLYNDPEKNAKVDQFNIEHKAPGKTNYAIELKLEGEEPVSNPGPKALIAIGN